MNGKFLRFNSARTIATDRHDTPWFLNKAMSFARKDGVVVAASAVRATPRTAAMRGIFAIADIKVRLVHVIGNGQKVEVDKILVYRRAVRRYVCSSIRLGHVHNSSFSSVSR
jgi:hypothetical protein